ncbi:MAG: TOMM precursor leader peptide-binding protein [Xanthomonadales bacterium]|nr:TOMM precursor leader peptide-binding protein [Xanthomonadales bacterium]
MLILTAGQFGEAVARRLQFDHNPNLPELSVAPLCQAREELAYLIPSHNFIAVVAWRPHVALLRWLDEQCEQAGSHWMFVEIDGQTMVNGPLFAQGSGRGCYHCFVARGDAYLRAGERTRALRQAYDKDCTLGPVGFTGPMVEIAAAGVRRAQHVLNLKACEEYGRFRRVDVLTGTIMESALVPRHDCPRCRPQGEDYDPTMRYQADMVPLLERLLEGA